MLAAFTGALPQNVNFATKADVARDYLAGIRLPLDESAAGQTMSAAAIGDLARAFTMKVECWR